MARILVLTANDRIRRQVCDTLYTHAHIPFPCRCCEEVTEKPDAAFYAPCAETFHDGVHEVREKFPDVPVVLFPPAAKPVSEILTACQKGVEAMIVPPFDHGAVPEVFNRLLNGAPAGELFEIMDNGDTGGGYILMPASGPSPA